MDNKKRYAGLEITSSVVRLVIGYVINKQVYVLHSLESKVNAVNQAYVTEEEPLVNAIKGVINAANETLKINIKEVVVAIPPLGLKSIHQSCSTNTISNDDVVAQIDINNAISQLRKIKLFEGVEIIDVIPFQFILENRDILEYPPIGKVSKTLTVHATIYAMNSNFIDGYRKAVIKAGLKVSRFVSAPLAGSLYLDYRQDVPSNYFLINMGSEITTISQISQGKIVVQSECSKFGSKDITDAISTTFDLSFDEANTLKEKYGMDMNPSYRVYISKNITLNDLTNSIHAVLEKPLNSIKGVLTNWVKDEGKTLPVVIIGGAMKLRGMAQYLEKKLGFDIIQIVPDTFGARDLSYITCLGLINYGDLYLINSDKEEEKMSLTNISRVDDGKKKQKENFDSSNEL